MNGGRQLHGGYDVVTITIDHLVIDGIALGIRTLGDLRAVGLAIKAVLDRGTCKGTARCDQLLCAAVIGEILLRRRSDKSRAITLDTEGGLSADSVVATIIISHIHIGRADVRVIVIADSVFRGRDHSLPVLYRHRGLLRRPVVGI